MGTTVLGDINVHNCAWLKRSSHTSVAGKQMARVCKEMGLEQRVTQPTREDNLLDLVLCDEAIPTRAGANQRPHGDS